MNNIHGIKHYLKVNIFKEAGDPLRTDLSNGPDVPNVLRTNLNTVFKFLKWKLAKLPNVFSTQDITIINTRDYLRFTHLSSRACSYSKALMRSYTERMWQMSIKYEYCNEGYNYLPIVSCESIPIPNHSIRDIETILMSHFYNNNLMNEFLFRLGHKDVSSPLCPCLKDRQTPYHSVIECTLIDYQIRQKLQEEVNGFLKDNHDEGMHIIKDHTLLLNMSRNKNFVELMFKAIKVNLKSYRATIVLTTLQS